MPRERPFYRLPPEGEEWVPRNRLAKRFMRLVGTGRVNPAGEQTCQVSVPIAAQRALGWAAGTKVEWLVNEKLGLLMYRAVEEVADEVPSV